ncbi:MAG: hypothetical protein ABJA66_01165 [Actinomycetota bacterium]
MNSEELELSLRTEFESYLKNVLADMRQEVSEFQKQFEAEFEKHKAQLDEVFQNFSARIAADRELDVNFTETVIEHLRLSRDEGARITATAIAEAEDMEKENAFSSTVASSVGLSEIRDATNDISSKTTQSAILKTLVQHAAQFTPRGAFFIIKNEHLVGWRVFGKEGENADELAVREVFFPVAASTVLGEAVRSLTAVESSYGTYSDDSIYLNKLEFGHPDRMYAVPLVVRGRSVAVLYADYGTEGENVNIEALETLVRVASLTVEILASARGVQPPTEAVTEETAESTNNFEAPQPVTFETSAESEESIEDPREETVEESAPVYAESYQFAETESPKHEAESLTAAEETSEEKLTEPEEKHEAESFSEAEEIYSYTPSVEENFSYKPIEQPVEVFAEPDYQTPVESDSFSFRPSGNTETVPSEFVSEVSDNAVKEVSIPEETLDEPKDFHVSPEEVQTFEPAPTWSQTVETEDYFSKETPVEYETPSYKISEPQTFETEIPVAETEYAPSLSSEYQFETPKIEYEETPSFETPQYEVENFRPTNGQSYDSIATENGKVESVVAEPVETVSEVAVKQPVKSRFSERNVDLPIEVSEDERRLHNDARRFARLLVSEIKLYNEQKVKEGRAGSDLYERLREAIDRSREMYDKRVQPPVAAKFDYFHYELVSNLAEGDENKLGAAYPGKLSS